MLQAGDEQVAGTNNNLDGEIISGNKLVLEWQRYVEHHSWSFSPGITSMHPPYTTILTKSRWVCCVNRMGMTNTSEELHII